MTIVYVAYAGDAATRFHRDYYVAHHLPLVMEAWGRHGLESCSAFFPFAAWTLPGASGAGAAQEIVARQSARGVPAGASGPRRRDRRGRPSQTMLDRWITGGPV